MQLNSALLNQIKEKMNQQTDSLFQITCAINNDFDCLKVAAQSDINEIIYFSKPKQTIEYLAFGSWRVVNNKELKSILDLNHADIRWFGINAFSLESKKSTEYWTLPKVWFEKSKNNVQLNIVIDSKKNTKDVCLDGVLKILEKIDTTKKPFEDQVYVNQDHVPDKPSWVNMVNEAQQKILKEELKKVVLARQSTYQFKDKVNPFLLLKKVQDKDNGVYNFCIKTSQNYAFIGGTPERLFEIKSGKITSDAIAGTLFKPEGADVMKLKNQLLSSKKNIGEHQHVVDFISEQLATICKKVSVDQNRSLIELKFLLHLIMHFEGELKNGSDWLSAINALHPTPAVGGVPSHEALSFINQYEPFDRGWYAGPMGTITKSEAHIVVAIRSGDVIDNRVILAAGAGIVADSDADSEWDELNAKINLFTSIFKDHA